jgi:hypothetical protein
MRVAAAVMLLAGVAIGLSEPSGLGVTQVPNGRRKSATARHGSSAWRDKATVDALLMP